MNISKILPLAFATALLTPSLSHGASLAWDPLGTPGGTVSAPTGSGGAGAWNTTSTFWSNSTGDVAWNNSNNDNAIFAGAAGGTVTLGVPIIVNNLTINTLGYVLSGSGANTLTVNGSITSTQSTVLSVTVTGTNGLTKIGAGTLGLNAANTYTGDTVIVSGTLQPRAANALPTATRVVFGNGGSTAGSLDVRTNQTISGLAINGTGAASITNSQTASTVLTINPDGAGVGAADSTFSGTIRNGDATHILGLTKAGSKTLTLTGANTYSGTTTVSGGTLLVNNTTGSGVGTGPVVASGTGTIGGTGFIALTGANGLSFATGSGVDLSTTAGVNTLTFNLTGTTGGATFDSGSTFKFDLAAANASDVLAFTGMTDASVLTLNGNVVTITNAAVGLYTLFTFDDVVADNYTGTLSNSIVGLAGGSANWIYNANSIQLNITAVPEPSTYVLLGLGLVALVYLRRRAKA